MQISITTTINVSTTDIQKAGNGVHKAIHRILTAANVAEEGNNNVMLDFSVVEIRPNSKVNIQFPDHLDG